MQARDIMTRKVLSVTPNISIKELGHFLLEHKISGAPVVNEDGDFLGLITEKQLIEQNKRLHIPTVITIMEAVIYLESPKHLEEELQEMLASTVADLYLKDAVTVAEDAELEEIATIMSQPGNQLIPVLRNGELVGIIGKADVVRAITK